MKIIKKISENKLLIQFSCKEKLDFETLLSQIKSLQGQEFNKDLKGWIIPLNSFNLQKLNNLGFVVQNQDNKIKQIKNIEINIHNDKIIIKADFSFLIELQDYFTYPDYSYCFQNGTFNKDKVVKRKFMKIRNDEAILPIGFRQELINYFKEKNLQFIYKDNRQIINFSFTDEQIKICLEYLELYPEQIEAIKFCLKNINGIVSLIGGLGKTEIMLALCKLLNIKTLILTESIDLCQQTYERTLKAKLNAGILQGKSINEKDITIATIQSIHKLKNSYQMVLIDECHNISKSYNNILCSEQFIYRFGFSASVFGKNKIKNIIIKQYIGNIIYTKENSILIEENKIAKPNFNIIKIDKPDLNKLKDWQTIEKLGIINNSIRNNIILDLCKTFNKQTLILVKKLKHGKILKELLENNNLKCIFLQGITDKETRQKVLKNFDENKNEFILIGSTILKEGISIDAIFNLIYAGAGTSFVDTIQSIFRGTRIKLKNEFNVYDFYDEFNTITLRHSKQRIDYYEKFIYNNISYIYK